mgnify:CR=1 FL=1
MLKLVDGIYKSSLSRIPERSCCFSVEYYENYIEEIREVMSDG